MEYRVIINENKDDMEAQTRGLRNNRNANKIGLQLIKINQIANIQNQPMPKDSPRCEWKVGRFLVNYSAGLPSTKRRINKKGRKRQKPT